MKSRSTEGGASRYATSNSSSAAWTICRKVARAKSMLRVTLEQPKDPLHVPLRALLACNGKDAPELLPLVGGALAQGVDEHERALALPDVAEDLLAVLGLVADQVQDVVLDLERRAEQETEQVEAVGVDRAALSRSAHRCGRGGCTCTSTSS